jgi:hypothetical protein
MEEEQEPYVEVYDKDDTTEYCIAKLKLDNGSIWIVKFERPRTDRVFVFRDIFADAEPGSKRFFSKIETDVHPKQNKYN